MLLPSLAFVSQSALVPLVLSDMYTAVCSLSLSVHQRSADSAVFRPDHFKMVLLDDAGLNKVLFIILSL